MNPDSQLVIGIVLISIGALVGLMAYIIMADRSSDDTKQEAAALDDHDEEDEEVEEEPQGETMTPDEGEEPESEAEPEIETGADLAEEVAPPQEQVAAESEAVPEPQPEPEEEEPMVTEQIEQLETPEEDTETPPSEHIPIATLMRDEVTGLLVVKVGDRVYQTSQELKTSSDWTRVEYAAADLATWLSEMPVIPRLKEDKKDDAEFRSRSMIEQINEVLQEKLIDQPEDAKAVRLIESTDGTVRVLIGVNSYALDDVPDEKISQLIRESVEAWEARQ